MLDNLFIIMKTACILFLVTLFFIVLDDIAINVEK